MSEFGLDLSKFKRRTVEGIDRTSRGVAIRLFRAIILDTPVLTGRLRANWQISLNGFNPTVTDGMDPTGAATIGAMTFVCGQSSSGDGFYMMNSLPYASRIEYDGWSHTKAPAGMVRKNVTRFRALLKENLAKQGLELAD